MRVLIACGVLLGSSFPAAAASRSDRAGAARLEAASQPAPAGGAAPADDPWGFDAEDEVETWSDILRPQALDIAMTTAFIAFALVGFFRKSVKLKYVTLGLAVAYMGFTKSQLISVTDIFRVVDLNLPTFKYSVAWYIFAGFTIVSTVLWGRLYCGRICAFGALTQLMDATIPSRFRVEPPAWLERRAGFVKYGLLAAVLVYYIVTRHTYVYRYVEPFWMFTLTATPLLWVMLAAAAGRHRRRAEPVLPLSLSGRRDARHPVESHRLQDQALVGVQDLQDLREDLRVGGDSGPEDHQVGVRPLRRLRAPLHGPEEVPPLADHHQKGPEGGGPFDSSARVAAGCFTHQRLAGTSRFNSSAQLRITTICEASASSRRRPSSFIIRNR